MSTVRAAALVVRFFCELSMLAALAYLGFEAGGSGWGWILGIGAPALAATIWGAFVASKAKWPVAVPTRLAIEALLFGTAAAGLVATDHPALGVALAVAAGVTSPINAGHPTTTSSDGAV